MRAHIFPLELMFYCPTFHIYVWDFKEARSASLYIYNRSKFGNMLSIPNKLTLQKESQNFVTNNVFLDKK